MCLKSPGGIAAVLPNSMWKLRWLHKILGTTPAHGLMIFNFVVCEQQCRDPCFYPYVLWPVKRYHMNIWFWSNI